MRTATDSSTVARVRSEELVVGAVVTLLRKEGYRVRREVPCMGSSIDIVATRGRWLTCVEVKVSAWQRALKQCFAHRLVADFLVIAVASPKITSRLIAIAAEHGIGVIHIDWVTTQASWALHPRAGEGVWLPQRRQLAAAVREIQYVD